MNRTMQSGSVPPASVFLDPSGRRRQWSRLLFRFIVAGFAAYVALLAASLIRDPRLAAVAPQPLSGGFGRRFIYSPPTIPSGAARSDDASAVAPATVPDYAAALAGITAPGAGPSQPLGPASAAPKANDAKDANDAAPRSVHPGPVAVMTTLRSSDWPVSTGSSPSTTAPSAGSTASPAPAGSSAPPPTTTTTLDSNGSPPPPTTTTTATTAPPPPTATTDGRGPDGQGPPGLVRRTASQPTS